MTRLERRMAASAAAGRRVVNGGGTSPDGRLVTSARETDEGTLVITITGPPVESLVRVGWTLLLPDAVTSTRWLVTPLAATRRGHEAEYDVGDVRAAQAVDVSPGTVIGRALPDPGEVATAFEVVQYGSARRAWLVALREGVLPAEVREQVIGCLQAESGSRWRWAGP